MSQSKNRMPYGILCNSFELQRWQMAIIDHLSQNDIKPVLLIMPSLQPELRPSFVDKLRNYPYKNLIFRVYYRFVLKPKAKQTLLMDASLRTIPSISCKVEKKGIGEYFRQDDIDKIKSSGATFLIRFGFGILKGDILDCTKFGVWSFHHDDPEVVRGVPSNFWELAEGLTVNGAILQRLTTKIDAGIVLRQGWFGTISHSWEANIDQAYWGTALWPLAVCNQLIHGKAFPDKAEVLIKPSPMRFAPTNHAMVKMLAKMWANKLVFHLKELFITEKWQIGLMNKPYRDVLMKNETLQAECILKGRSKSHYLADPHLFTHKHSTYVLYEDYDYKDRHGRIYIQEFDTGLLPKAAPRRAIERPYHLAFPFVMEHEGNTYCLPENSLGNSLDIYQFNPDSKQFTFKQTLIPDVAAIDPVLFKHQSKWWLFCSDKKSTNTLLNIWFADDLFGPWQPHLLNPVKTDIRSARPAGPICKVDGRLIRPAQDCARYSGHRIAVMEIETLTPIEFSEKLIHYLEFTTPSTVKGIHTLSGNDHYTAFDQKYHVFIWESFWQQMKRKLHL
jgi:hypothetical protein